MVGLPDGEQTLRMDVFCGVDKIPACDRQTDVLTDILRRHSPRYAYASRGNDVADNQNASVSVVKCRRRAVPCQRVTQTDSVPLASHYTSRRRRRRRCCSRCTLAVVVLSGNSHYTDQSDLQAK